MPDHPQRFRRLYVRLLTATAALLLAAPYLARANEPSTQPAPATRPSGVISAEDDAALKKALQSGKLVEIEGTIAHADWSRTGNVMTIVFRTSAGLAGDPPGTGLVAAVFKRDREAFDKELAGDAAKSLTGAKVRLRGKLVPYAGYDESFKGCPQLVLNRPTQVTILPKPAAD